jgi:2-polyprenyl-6-hydroxyphenyl methylase/3-demethylubiquinone-9 3-methyltransferase
VTVQADQNIDSTEREKFDSVAAGWWDPEGPFRPLHDLNPARLRFITDRAPMAEADVLDVGCGGGILAESMARKGARVLGQGDRIGSIEKGKQADLCAVDLSAPETQPLHHVAQESPQKFDTVTCMEMLEHVPDPASIIAAIRTLLKPRGQVFLSTLNRTPLAFALGIVGAEHIARLLPRGTHRYDRFIRPSELSAWLREAGLLVQDIVGLHYNPITRSVMLGGNVKVNYLVHAVKPET